MGKETSTNYYDVLQVSPSADREMIERAFRLLAKRYHPDNKDTGDAGKFKFLVEAYRVLSDSEKRAAYDDRNKTFDTHEDNILFNAPQSRDPEAERRINQVILFIFYLARKRDAVKPGVGIVELEKLAGLPERELNFHIWYLKEKGWIQRIETGEFAITASGVDEVMERNLTLKRDRLLPAANEFS
jgi:curved DNA-binding protein CbpA